MTTQPQCTKPEEEKIYKCSDCDAWVKPSESCCGFGTEYHDGSGFDDCDSENTGWRTCKEISDKSKWCSECIYLNRSKVEEEGDWWIAHNGNIKFITSTLTKVENMGADEWGLIRSFTDNRETEKDLCGCLLEHAGVCDEDEEPVCPECGREGYGMACEQCEDCGGWNGTGGGDCECECNEKKLV